MSVKARREISHSLRGNKHWKPSLKFRAWFSSAPPGATSGTSFILSERQVSYFSREEKELYHGSVRTSVFIDISSPLRTKTRQPLRAILPLTSQVPELKPWSSHHEYLRQQTVLETNPLQKISWRCVFLQASGFLSGFGTQASALVRNLVFIFCTCTRVRVVFCSFSCTFLFFSSLSNTELLAPVF